MSASVNDDFLSRAGTAPAELRNQLFDLPRIIVDWMAPYGGVAGRRVMDLGCGHGILAAGLALGYGPKFVCGVEVTTEPEKLPSILQDRVGVDVPANLEFRRIKAGEMCEDRDFDVVVSWSVLEHLQRNSFDAIMGQVRDRMKPGGLMFIQISPLYFSPEGSHLWALGYTDWQHLTREMSEVREDLDAAELTDRQRELLWKLFVRLNRYTAPDIETRLTGLGFTVLRRQVDRVDREPPAELLTAYTHDALTTHQIVLLLQRGD